MSVPADFARRSQVYRRHCNAKATFDVVAKSCVVSNYTSVDDEIDRAANLALLDLSTLPRTGLRGSSAASCLTHRGAVLPDRTNRAVGQNDGSLVARVSGTEFLILDSLDGGSTLIAEHDENGNSISGEGVYSLPRADSHCLFAITGTQAARMLAKVCSIDLRPGKFDGGEVAQTSLARSNVIIIRNDFGETVGYFMLGDASLAEYLWDVLQDAMLEFDGCPAGILALRALKNRHR